MGEGLCGGVNQTHRILVVKTKYACLGMSQNDRWQHRQMEDGKGRIGHMDDCIWMIPPNKTSL